MFSILDLFVTYLIGDPIFHLTTISPLPAYSSFNTSKAGGVMEWSSSDPSSGTVPSSTTILCNVVMPAWARNLFTSVILIIRKRLPKRITYRNKCTSHGVVHCTSKNQINQEQLQEKCRREVGVMSSTILCCCPFLGCGWHYDTGNFLIPNVYLSWSIHI